MTLMSKDKRPRLKTSLMTKAYRLLTAVPLLYWFGLVCSRPGATKAVTPLYHSGDPNL
jgi:hypothetical protein